MNIQGVLNSLGIGKILDPAGTGSRWISSTQNQSAPIVSPVDGQSHYSVIFATDTEYESVMKRASEAFSIWREIPAPKRGEIVRLIGDELRRNKESLASLVSYEMGKSLQEGLGEVQEMIDICDFAVGLSRQLYGLTMHSERPQHRMYEQWHPLGIIGIISAFNFPVAVWSWNAMIAAVCGNVCLWKPSEKTPATASAIQNIISNVIISQKLPEGIFNVIQGGKDIGEKMATDNRIPLISATGSTKMGKAVGLSIAARLGKSILELGGNNAVIITENANLKLALRAVVFGAIGTAGQRCTTTRRVLVQKSIYDKFKSDLTKAYSQISIGNPLESENHMGPLIDKNAVELYKNALNNVVKEGGKIIFGGQILSGEKYQSGCYVTPAIVEAQNIYKTVQEETFAPILYLIPFNQLNEAIAMQNDVNQGLSSSIFTTQLSEAELFLSFKGSDCGIANVNIGTSGAEIGGAFGGEKETGGGRESGSDAWKAYMRRQTNSINYGEQLPLAQGISFDF